MTLNCTRYQQTMTNCLNTIKRDLDKGDSPVDIASRLCHLTSVPLAACVMFLMRPEVHGPTEELSDKLKSLVDFYHYTEIVPFN